MSRKDLFIQLILESLKRSERSIKHQWNHPEGTTTSHFWVDELLPVEIAHEIYKAFPNESDRWMQRESFGEKKKTLAKLANVSEILTEVTFAIQSPSVLQKVASLTGSHGLVGDPLLYAGGLSMMEKGDFLNPHIDNSHNIDRSLYRKFNVCVASRLSGVLRMEAI